MPTNLVVVCGGGHACEILWLAAHATERFRVLGYLDEQERDNVPVAPYLGSLDRASDFGGSHFVVAVGSPRIRRRLVLRLAELGITRFARLIHEDATVASTDDIGPGSQICAGARITTNVEMGSHVIVNQNSTLAHDSRIGDWVTIAPLAALSGGVRLGPGAEVGTGAALRQGVRMGSGAMAGMGAVVLDDVEDNQLVVGNPARHLRFLEPLD